MAPTVLDLYRRAMDADIDLPAYGGGEPSVNRRECGIGAARSFEPDDRLAAARLQQMRLSDLEK